MSNTPTCHMHSDYDAACETCRSIVQTYFSSAADYPSPLLHPLGGAATPTPCESHKEYQPGCNACNPAGWEAFQRAIMAAKRAGSLGVVPREADTLETLDDCIEEAWGIIANANEGLWDRAQPDWREAANRWRDKWVGQMSARVAARLSSSRDAAGEEDRARRIVLSGAWPQSPFNDEDWSAAQRDLTVEEIRMLRRGQCPHCYSLSVQGDAFSGEHRVRCVKTYGGGCGALFVLPSISAASAPPEEPT